MRNAVQRLIAAVRDLANLLLVAPDEVAAQSSGIADELRQLADAAEKETADR